MKVGVPAVLLLMVLSACAQESVEPFFGEAPTFPPSDGIKMEMNGVAGGGAIYRRRGNLTFGSDGTIYRRIGSTTIGSDGTTYVRAGNTTLGSDGTSYRSIGTTTVGSDGTVCRQAGNADIC